MASRLENITPHTTTNIADAVVIQNKSDVPIFWSNETFSDSGDGNELQAGGTIAVATAGVFVRNDTCFEDINVWVETDRP